MCNPELNPEGIWVDPCSGEVLEPNYVHQSFEVVDAVRKPRFEQIAGLPQFYGSIDYGYGSDVRLKTINKLSTMLRKLRKMNLSLCALHQASHLVRILVKSRARITNSIDRDLEAIANVAKILCGEDAELDMTLAFKLQKILAEAGYKINIIAKRNIKPYVDWELEFLARELEKKAKIEFVTKEIHSGALFLASLILYNVEGRQRASQGEIARYYDISKETLRRYYRSLARKLGYKIVMCQDTRPYLEKCPG
jgi:hypothetical protein